MSVDGIAVGVAHLCDVGGGWGDIVAGELSALGAGLIWQLSEARPQYDTRRRASKNIGLLPSCFPRGEVAFSLET